MKNTDVSFPFISFSYSQQTSVFIHLFLKMYHPLITHTTTLLTSLASTSIPRTRILLRMVFEYIVEVIVRFGKMNNINDCILRNDYLTDVTRIETPCLRLSPSWPLLTMEKMCCNLERSSFRNVLRNSAALMQYTFLSMYATAATMRTNHC